MQRERTLDRSASMITPQIPKKDEISQKLRRKEKQISHKIFKATQNLLKDKEPSRDTELKEGEAQILLDKIFNKKRFQFPMEQFPRYICLKTFGFL